MSKYSYQFSIVCKACIGLALVIIREYNARGYDNRIESKHLVVVINELLLIGRDTHIMGNGEQNG